MMHNAKYFVQALLARNKYSKLLNLSKLKSGKVFNKSFLHTTKILLDCTNTITVNNTDRADLEAHKGGLEREHVKYLLGQD